MKLRVNQIRYQHTPAGWQWASPTADLWGEPQHLTTRYVVWHYRAQDVAVVATVAPQIEALYATLRRHFALADETLTAPLTIEVSITPPPAWRAAWRARCQIVVPIPALYRSPVGLTDAELIVQAVALPLLDNVIAQAYTRYQWAAPWQPMVLGLRLWQLWDLIYRWQSGRHALCLGSMRIACGMMRPNRICCLLGMLLSVQAMPCGSHHRCRLGFPYYVQN